VYALAGAALDALWADEVRRLGDLANVQHATLGRRRERGGGSAAAASGSRAAPTPTDVGRDRAGAALAAATAAKPTGNPHFATCRHRPAVAVDTKCGDVLRRAGQSEVGGLAPEAAALLAVLLANRGASQLMLAGAGRPDSSALSAAQAAAADCAEVLASPMFRGPGGELPGEPACHVPAGLVAKVRQRAIAAAERQRVPRRQLAAARAEAAAAGEAAEEADAAVADGASSSLFRGGGERRRHGRRAAVGAAGFR